MASSSTHESPPGDPSRALSPPSGGCFWFPLGTEGCLASGWWRQYAGGIVFRWTESYQSCLGPPAIAKSPGGFLRFCDGFQNLSVAAAQDVLQPPLTCVLRAIWGLPFTSDGAKLPIGFDSFRLSDSTHFYHPSYSCKSITESCTGPVLETCTAIRHISHTMLYLYPCENFHRYIIHSPGRYP